MSPPRRCRPSSEQSAFGAKQEEAVPIVPYTPPLHDAQVLPGLKPKAVQLWSCLALRWLCIRVYLLQHGGSYGVCRRITSDSLHVLTLFQHHASRCLPVYAVPRGPPVASENAACQQRVLGFLANAMFMRRQQDSFVDHNLCECLKHIHRLKLAGLAGN